MSDFSTNLKKLRKKENMSQDSLAEQLNVSRQTVSSWERGKSYPDLDMLVLICDALHTTPDRLLYPPEKRGRFSAEEIVNAIFFQKIAIAVLAIGFVLGISAGSEAYSPAPNTVGWHFVFSYAFQYWGCSFLIGMVFMGIGKILSLLYTIREME
jgi:transcriptional regulator with XRE-family HTH domain